MSLVKENIFGLSDDGSDFLNTLLFTGLGIDVSKYEEHEEFMDFKIVLKRYIENLQFKKARDEIICRLKKIEKSRRKFAHDILRVLYWFYLTLYKLDENILKKGGFSKDYVGECIIKIENIVMGKEDVEI